MGNTFLITCSGSRDLKWIDFERACISSKPNYRVAIFKEENNISLMVNQLKCWHNDSVLFTETVAMYKTASNTN